MSGGYQNLITFDSVKESATFFTPDKSSSIFWTVQGKQQEGVFPAIDT